MVTMLRGAGYRPAFTILGHLVLAGSALAAGIMSPLAAAAGDVPIALTFGGTPGVAFQATCVLATSSGTVRLTYDALTPRHYSLSGQGLDCLITRRQGEGRLMVEVNKANGTISRSSVSGGSSRVRISVH